MSFMSYKSCMFVHDILTMCIEPFERPQSKQRAWLACSFIPKVRALDPHIPNARTYR